jgi:CRISPR/Cas system-associated exonuclease Cas4 (RecB family)
MPTENSITLTKSDYLQYLTCPQAFWMVKHQQIDMPGPTEAVQLLFEQGNLVDKLAQQLFQKDSFLAERGYQPDAIRFQETVTEGGLLARCDIMVETESGHFLFEVKDSTRVKEEHLHDLAFQKVAFEKGGYSLPRVFLIHINPEYVRNGSPDPEEYLAVVDLTAEIEALLVDTRIRIEEALQFLQGPQPAAQKDHFCDLKADCPYFQFHFPELPDYSVFDISRINKKKLKALLKSGIHSIHEVPVDFPLSDKQRFQVEVAQSGDVQVDRDAIRTRLEALQFPLYFLDYETFPFVLPFQDGYAPYGHMVFQYSLHVLEAPDADLQHVEYLLAAKEEPVQNLVEHLANAMSAEKGSVIVWNDSFEKARNRELGALFPKYAAFFQSVNDRIFDLARIFADQLYVHPDFKGSYSIKKVLPVLAPELSYESLAVGNGSAANWHWHRLTEGRVPEEEQEQVRQDLLAYCHLDTLAMVRVWEALNA